MTATPTAVRTSPHVARRAHLRAATAASPLHHGVPGEPSAPDIVEVWGLDSFPASDAPANW
jgi:hypothetical protein